MMLWLAITHCYRVQNLMRPHLKLVHGGVAVENCAPDLDRPNIDAVVLVLVHNVCQDRTQLLQWDLSHQTYHRVTDSPDRARIRSPLLPHQQRTCQEGAQETAEMREL